MQELHTDKKKTLHFEVSIQGINHNELEGALKFMIDDVQFGFPVKVLADQISVDIPPLDNVVARGLKDDEIIECKLDIFGKGFYLNPWQGKFQLKTPVKMEARMRVEDDIILEEPKPKAKEEPKQQILATLKEDAVEKTDKDYEFNLKQFIKETEEVDKEEPIIKEEKVLQKSVESKVKSKLSEMSSLVDDLLSNRKTKKRPIKGSKRVVKKATTKVIERKITSEDDVVNLMESYGLKNPKTQQALLERVKSMTDEPQGMYDAMLKMLGSNREMK